MAFAYNPSFVLESNVAPAEGLQGKTQRRSALQIHQRHPADEVKMPTIERPGAERLTPPGSATLGRARPRLMVGSGNEHKTAEIAAIFAGLPIEVVSARILGRIPELAESGATFEDNAALKARAFARLAAALPPPSRPRWVLADDSGLCVDALDGEPGLRSARYAQTRPDEKVADADNNRKLLARLEGVPPERRGARFVSTLALAEVPQRPDGAAEPPIVLASRGECAGRIGDAPRGSGGFGYDPLFEVPELGATFAEIPAAEKNRRSHRARALAALKPRLAALLAANT